MKKLIYLIVLLSLMSCVNTNCVIEGDIIKSIDSYSEQNNIYTTYGNNPDKILLDPAYFIAKKGLYQIGDVVKFCK